MQVQNISTITPKALRAALQVGTEIAVLDAREQGSYSKSHLLRASCVPLSRLELDAGRLLPRRDVRVVWCDEDGCGPSRQAAARLQRFGYRDVMVLAGGTAGWEACGYPLYSGVYVHSKAFAEVLEHTCATPWITPDDLHWRIARGEDVAIFDTRTYEEYHNNAIPGAISAPGAELVHRVASLVPSKDTLVVVNCGGRTRSIVGAQALISAGLSNRVVSLQNGTMGWQLAGLPVARGAERRAPLPAPEAVGLVASAAARLAQRLGIATIELATLTQWRQEQASRTLYVLDVRSAEEYIDGHLPGAINVPGGQLVQETDVWMAVWNARVVLVDDRALVRAHMTAVWLSQMGWTDTVVLPWVAERDGVERGSAQLEPLGWSALDAATATAIGPAALGALAAGDHVAIIDVGSSKFHRAGHLPGAWFAPRGCLPAQLGALPPARTLVFTSPDGRLARFAAADVVTLTALPVRWLEGGTDAWVAAGLPLEHGLTRALADPDDVWYSPRERGSGPEDGMRAYLEWELALADQVARDPDSMIRVLL